MTIKKNSFPKNIDGKSRREELFEQLTSHPDYEARHEAAMVQMVCLITDEEEYRAYIDEHGKFYDSGKMRRQHPELTALHATQASLKGLYAKFGMTPMDTKSLKKGVPDEDAVTVVQFPGLT